MKFKKILFPFVTYLPLLFLSCSSPLVYNSIWQDKPVTVDGKATEWKIPLDYFDDKTKLNFSISNDRTNIYFCIRATEDETQKGIIHNGLQIWIDTTGGKKDEVGIQFPLIQRQERTEGSLLTHSSQPDETPAAYNLRKQYSGTTKQMRLTGFSGAVEGLAEAPNMYGINACLNWDTNNIMIYEVCIPFKTFYKSSLSQSDSSKAFGVTFAVTVTPKASKYGGGGNSGGGGHGGGGGMGGMHGGGGGHGGGGHGGGGGSSPSAETISAHIKFRLAVGHQ
jgi:hypothetical protein